jgi:hypothetical protein
MFNRNQVKPAADVLKQCARVVVDGDRHKPKVMRDWAREHCSSLVWWESMDMSDMSSWTGFDNHVEFYFYVEEDATLFRLKWA